jgi:hypothetical protein
MLARRSVCVNLQAFERGINLLGGPAAFFQEGDGGEKKGEGRDKDYPVYEE